MNSTYLKEEEYNNISQRGRMIIYNIIYNSYREIRKQLKTPFLFIKPFSSPAEPRVLKHFVLDTERLMSLSFNLQQVGSV